MSQFSIHFDSATNLVDYIDRLIFSVREMNETVGLLESQQPEWDGSRQTFLAIGEQNLFQIPADEANSGRDFFSEFQRWLDLQTQPTIGWLGYDLKNGVEEGLRSDNPSALNEPILRFWQPQIWLSVDYKNLLITSEKALPLKFKSLLARESLKNSDTYYKEYGNWNLKPDAHQDEQNYRKIIREAKEQISEGTYYEINLSRQQTGTLSAHPFHLFRAMRQAGPVPMAAFLAWDDSAVCCLSPERFLKKTGKKLISEPIKGTRKRGKSKEEDDILKSELQHSEKERAENVMIVDLVRHDLNRVCKPGSVNVTELCNIRSYETVHQMVSVIEGEAKEEFSVSEILKAAFPMGSMTGAPKKSAMQDIERLESYFRGVYSGAIGYITPQHNFDFNVVIRTAISQKDQLIYPVGGAITADSDAKEEWHETEVKTQAFTSAKSI